MKLLKQLNFHAHIFIGQCFIKNIYNFIFIAYTVKDGSPTTERGTAALMNSFSFCCWPACLTRNLNQIHILSIYFIHNESHLKGLFRDMMQVNSK